MLIKKVGKTSWVPVCSLKTGSLERGRDYNYCRHKRKASSIQLLLFPFSGPSISTHTHTRYQAASREAALRWRAHALFQDRVLGQKTLGSESPDRKAGIGQIRREDNSKTQIQKKSNTVFHRMRYLKEECLIVLFTRTVLWLTAQ